MPDRHGSVRERASLGTRAGETGSRRSLDAGEGREGPRKAQYKNDAADAEAICEAVRRPTMRFVRIKSAEQQGQLMQHRTRDLLLRQRTQTINALRAHLVELGITAA